MSTSFDPANTLTPAGPLSFDGFVGAIFHASSALHRDGAVPGIPGPISLTDMWGAALLAVEPYCDGDRAGAVQAIADGLNPGWRGWPPQARQAAAAEGSALLIWLEGFNPRRN